MTIRTDDPFNVRQVAEVTAVLRTLGNVDAAQALGRQLGLASDAFALADDRLPEGWDATVHLANMVGHPSLGLPRTGDRVRVTFDDGRREPVTGEWHYIRGERDTEPGRVLVLDNDTSEAVQDLEGTTIEVLRMGRRLTGWDFPVDVAATILRSAWGVSTTVVDEYDPLNGCWGCDKNATGALACAHADGCTCRVCQANARLRPSRCEVCVEPTQYRVSAWAPVPQYAAAVGLAEDQADTLVLAEPGESAAGYVCSATCAREWIEITMARLLDSLGDREAARQHFSMTRWTYEPGPLDLPAPLAQSRAAARYLADYLDTVAAQWFHTGTGWERDTRNGTGPVLYRVENLRARVAEVVDHVAALPNHDTAWLWPRSLIAIGEHVLVGAGDLPESLAHRTQVDPARYQVGAATVYDRVGQAYLCLACPAETPVPLLSVDVVRGTLRDGLALRCVGCDAVLVAPDTRGV